MIINLINFPWGVSREERVQGCAPPPPFPEITCGFLVQLVFCRKNCGLLVLRLNMR